MTIHLTRREHETWLAIAEGLSIGETAVKLGLSKATISTYREGLYGQLGAYNAVLATLEAVRHGIVTIKPPTARIEVSAARGGNWR